MKIAIIASIWIQIPPPHFGFGAQEYLAYHLTEGLVKKGHEVTLFASGDSHTSAHLVSITDKQVKDLPSEDTRIKDMFELMNIAEAYKHASSFDIIHNHLLPYGLFFTQNSPTPTVHTLHHQIYTRRGEMYAYQQYKDQRYISISNTQRFVVPNLQYIATVYNGIDPNFFTYASQPENYLLYIGRIKRYKGIHTAIKIAQQTGMALKIAGPEPQPSQPDYKEVHSYWEEEIKPHLGGVITYVGSVEGDAKVSLLQKAKALLFPVEREEPFGMTLIEAMSCGTPVIAYSGGAVPEIVQDGKTGFIINPTANNNRGDWIIREFGLEGLRQAVERLQRLDNNSYQNIRQAARSHVENTFTIEHMVNEYENVYKKILAK